MASNLLRNLDRVAGVAGNVFLGENERRQALLQEHLQRSQKQGIEQQGQDARSDLLRQRLMFEKRDTDIKLAEQRRQFDKEFEYQKKLDQDRMGLTAKKFEESKKKNQFDQKKQERESFKEQMNAFRSNIDLLNDRLRILIGARRSEPEEINKILSEIEVQEGARDIFYKTKGKQIGLDVFDDARRVILEAEEKKGKAYQRFMNSDQFVGPRRIGNTTYKSPKGTVADEQSNWSGYEE